MMIDFGVTPGKLEELRHRMETLGVYEADLEESFVRSGGPGGQKVNKSATCVRLRHHPSDLEVKVQRTRNQQLNRYYARKRLCELLEARQMGTSSPANRRRVQLAKQKARRKRRSRKKLGPDTSE